MKTIAKSTIILAALVTLASCEFFKKNGETITDTEVKTLETTTGINADSSAAIVSTTTTGITE